MGDSAPRLDDSLDALDILDMANLKILIASMLVLGAVVAAPALAHSATLTGTAGAPQVQSAADVSQPAATPQCGGDTKTDTKPKS